MYGQAGFLLLRKTRLAPRREAENAATPEEKRTTGGCLVSLWSFSPSEQAGFIESDEGPTSHGEVSKKQPGAAQLLPTLSPVR
jgi:hypothetical protein